MADQCIVCLENLDVEPSALQQLPTAAAASSSSSTASCSGPDALPLDGSSHSRSHHSGTQTTDPTGEAQSTPAAAATPPPPPPQLQLNGTAKSTTPSDEDKIAVIDACGHTLHDACLREWTGKANSCPICRQSFNLVHVYNKVGGTQLSSYSVEDKKQVVEFDAQAWLEENPDDEEETRSCPICSRSDHEELLLLCDNCDAPYHTFCVGLDSVPRGHWFCMECAESHRALLADELDSQDDDISLGVVGVADHRSPYLPRTQATMRRARRRDRSDEWQGAWGQIAGRVFEVLNIDLDGHDDDEVLRNYRRSQQLRERERREYQRWQQRLNIADRLGAREVFTNNLPHVLPQSVAQEPPPPPPQESPEERQAWGALEKAMDAATPSRPSPNHRKRKSRSTTASPVEPPPQPERKLKRPRTRRVPTQSEASSSKTPAIRLELRPHTESAPSQPPRQASPPREEQTPTFLSSLLREVEMTPSSDDENIRALFGPPRTGADPSSPVTSPSPSAHSSPRALSTTPPPRGINDRPGSPLSLTSRIEPIYPPANYSPTRNGADHSDSESKSRGALHSPTAARSPEIRQPRPRRQTTANISANLARSQETSPTRALPFEVKENVSGIVKHALKSHWKSGKITADQYATINRDISRKLYEEVSDVALNDDVRHRCEKIAAAEVAKAVGDPMAP